MPRGDDAAEMGVASLTVVEHVDVVENTSARARTGPPPGEPRSCDTFAAVSPLVFGGARVPAGIGERVTGPNGSFACVWLAAGR